MAEMMGGPLDGKFEEPIRCTECDRGEVMDIVETVEGPNGQLQEHLYSYDEQTGRWQWLGHENVEVS
ncbi:hypothetical protein SEA_REDWATTLEHOG_122 [Gordonia phage RedWattleHog]|uniref:Uncharacterized protein n=1 Tax=Gordonia phage Stormageddon TaxID=2656541 RepID=A0A649VRV4_9CAUD|nr:hypothetical protein KHQ86_gp179 [Gordonia phage Stormageddon]QGJ94981.1 hypothetical protein SEA_STORMAGEDDON_121 [Gordonia phage Stormageddon]QLF83625.1 hypothetical protein SEA_REDWATTLEHOG_122 [Gordonia phage RedWattleHog]